VDTSQIQSRVTGRCANTANASSAISGIAADGSASCTPIPGHVRDGRIDNQNWNADGALHDLAGLSLTPGTWRATPPSQYTVDTGFNVFGYSLRAGCRMMDQASGKTSESANTTAFAPSGQVQTTAFNYTLVVDGVFTNTSAPFIIMSCNGAKVAGGPTSYF